MSDINRILDNWFGERLEDSEDEVNRRKHLYEPLIALVEKSYEDGFNDARANELESLSILTSR